MTKDPREIAIRDFLLDINCLDDLQKWGSSFNIFEILKISRAEIRHSNVLAWLLNPNENHTLGDMFVKKLFQYFVKGLSFTNKASMDLLLMDFYSFTVLREWKNIDILMISDQEKVIVAFENKVGTSEHDNQLQRYKDILNKEYPNYTKFLIYLTPDGDTPSDNDWEILTYEDVANTLSDICNRNSIPQNVLYMINNYIDIIRRDVMEDKELIEICNRIYSKHKKALDLIYEYKMDQTQAADTINEVLKKLADDGKVVYEGTKGNTYVRFYTTAMTNYLPNLDTKDGSWGNEHTYAYEFRLMNGKFRISFVLAGKNVPDSTMNHMRKILEIMRPNRLEKEFQWISINTKKFNLNEEYDDTSDLTSLIKKAIKSQLDWEEKILSKIAEK
jgi:hypothetical protein